MNTNEIKNDTNEPTKLVDQKPCFITSNALVFTNLHNAAVEKAAKKIGVSSNSADINQFFINTGMSDDGRTISNKNEKINNKIRFKSEKFEFGIVMQVNDAKNKTKLDADKDQVKQDEEARRKAVENAKKLILDGINEYFQWFAGANNVFTEDDLVEFIPDYNGSKVQIKNSQIIGIDIKKEMKKRKIQDENELKYRIGFKVGYTINYNK